MSSALDNTFGALMIGVIFGAALFGVSCVQTWFYYTNYPRDPWNVKLLVAAVFISDMIHQILISHTIYTYTITYYGVPSELGIIVNTIVIEVLFNGFTALMVQGFFVFRIWKLSHGNIILTGVVVALVVGEFGCVLAYVTKALKIELLADLSLVKNLSMTVNILAAAGDIVIAGAMCALLHSSRTGFKQSDTVINRLMIFIINTGLLTSIDAVASLVSIVAWPNTFIYICFYFTLGRLYSNSLFATLNARSSIRSASQGNVSGEEFSLSFGGTRSQTMLGNGGRSKGGDAMPMQIQSQGKAHNHPFVVVERTTEQHSDAQSVETFHKTAVDV